MEWMCDELKFLVRDVATWASHPSSESADLVVVAWHHVQDSCHGHFQAVAGILPGCAPPQWFVIRLLLELAGRELSAVDAAAYLFFAGRVLVRFPTHPSLAFLVDLLCARLDRGAIAA